MCSPASRPARRLGLHARSRRRSARVTLGLSARERTCCRFRRATSSASWGRSTHLRSFATPSPTGCLPPIRHRTTRTSATSGDSSIPARASTLPRTRASTAPPALTSRRPPRGTSPRERPGTRRRSPQRRSSALSTAASTTTTRTSLRISGRIRSRSTSSTRSRTAAASSTRTRPARQARTAGTPSGTCAIPTIQPPRRGTAR